MSDRGERNHNPFNLRYSPKIPWLGLATPPQDAEGYCVFADDAHGLRAGFRDLYVAWEVDGLSTVAELVPHFAPAADHNDVAAYVADVCRQLGTAPTDPIDDLTVAGNLLALGAAFIHHENGGCPYTPTQLATAVQQALHNW